MKFIRRTVTVYTANYAKLNLETQSIESQVQVEFYKKPSKREIERNRGDHEVFINVTSHEKEYEMPIDLFVETCNKYVLDLADEDETE